MWKRKKKQAEPSEQDAPAIPAAAIPSDDEAPTQPLRSGADLPTQPRPASDEAPTKPLRTPDDTPTKPMHLSGDGPADSQADETLHLSDDMRTTHTGAPDGRPPADAGDGATRVVAAAQDDEPRPAEADAPTVAIRPEYERRLPDAPEPIPAPGDGAAVTDGEATVQVGRPSPLDPTAAPDEDATVPLNRGKSS